MVLSFTDPDKWYEEYESASPKRRYEILMETIEHPLSKKFIKEADLGMCLVELRDELVTNNLIEEVISFFDKLRAKQPDLYREDFQYYDNFLVEYYLFKDEPEKVAEALSRFMENPVQGIDQMKVLLDELRFYGYTDLAVELCRRTYAPVKSSSKLIEGAELDLADVIFVDLVDKAYQQIRMGKAVDWKKFISQAMKYDFTDSEEMAEEIRVYLTEEIEGGEKFVTQFKRDRDERLDALSWEFSKYMFEQKDVGFICSDGIWGEVLEFLEERKPSRRKSVAPNVYFGFSDAELDRYLGEVIGGFMSNQQAKGVAILWSLPYIYDLLLSKEIITYSVYQKVTKSVASLKSVLIKALQSSLWQYDFVHRWGPPDSIPREDFAIESEKFKETIKVKTPLSDQPTDGEKDLFGGW